MTKVEIGILEVLRDGGAAAISDLPSLLASSPKDTGQEKIDATAEQVALALVTLHAAGFLVDVSDDVIAWTGAEWTG